MTILKKHHTLGAYYILHITYYILHVSEDDGCVAGYQMVPTNNAVFPGGDAQCCDIGRPYCCVDIPEIYVICVYNATYSWGEFLKTGEKTRP